MFSRYLRTRERNGIVAVFHELHPDPIYCTDKKWKDIFYGIDTDEVFISNLKDKKIIIEVSGDDDFEFERVASLVEQKFNKTTILYLMTAQGCNFGCGYCPVPINAKKHGASLLSFENAFKGIELWQRHINDCYDPNLKYFVIFYGGEPLLNKGVIKKTLACLKMKKEEGVIPPNINFMIATNGVLVDDEDVTIVTANQIPTF